MEYLEQFKSLVFAGNTVYDYILAGAIFIGLIIVLKIIKMIIVGRLRHLAKKTKTDFDDTLIEIFGKVKPPFYFFVSLYFSIKYLTLPEIVNEGVQILFLIIIIWEVVNGLAKLVDYFASKYLAQTVGKGGAGQSKAMVQALNIIVKMILWLLGLTLLLANLGVNVTSIIASLGIGGLAIALALQNILSDIFSSFSIYIDKPFKIGDFIVIGDHSGTVEKIGLKTTRVRTLQGQELVLSNNELTSARVENFKQMEKRRVLFTLGVIYEIKPAQLEKIPSIIQEIVKGVKGADFDRCHFKSYGDSSLNFEIAYYVNSAEYIDYLNINQKVNLAIFNRFTKEKIEFAYPTRTVYMQK
ncbi:MAG: mechanosensitive ion channel protein MscS [Parcubacteria group bacterium]|nr:mechanosensitive ion channel protein MscS [Parcubacteria group bacterium]|tara:strand:- start:403 stop:1467 length:1065 start_codon:yes stop_codon:yes gene_type:complete